MKFVKYHGLGNDFIIVDARDISEEIDVPSLCNRHLGIGADGLIVFDILLNGDYQMQIFNADGSEATMCGNGLRCLAHVIYGISGLDEVHIVSKSGRHRCQVSGNNVRACLGDLPEVKEISLEGESCFFVNTGAPHVVLFVSDLTDSDLMEKAKRIRCHPDFQSVGTNVTFAKKTDHGLEVRVFEKGVESETFACGTGAAAAVMASGLQLVTEVKFFLSGSLKVHSSDMLEIEGEAVPVFAGSAFKNVLTFSEVL